VITGVYGIIDFREYACVMCMTILSLANSFRGACLLTGAMITTTYRRVNNL